MAQKLPIIFEPMRGLPQGCTVDDVIDFPDEAARWLNVTPVWAVKHQDALPGVIHETRKTKKFHPRTYLDKRLNLNSQ